MSDREGGILGPFLLGIAVGAALGALFAPDTGAVTRRQLRKKLRGLRDLAEDKADELKSLMAGVDDDSDEFDDLEESEEPDETDEADEPDEGEPKSARDELEHRLAEARRRRRQAGRPRDAKEDEPVA